MLGLTFKTTRDYEGYNEGTIIYRLLIKSKIIYDRIYDLTTMSDFNLHVAAWYSKTLLTKQPCGSGTWIISR